MPTQPFTPGPPAQPDDHSLVTYTNIIYALHTFGVLMGVLSTATTVVGGFVFSVPSIIAVILNYAKRSAVRGTWLESHFNWQIHTFWYALLWLVVAAVLFMTVVGIVLAYILAVGVGFWIVYRILRGWMALNDERAV